MSDNLSRTALKEHAQEVLMHGIANMLGYYDPKDDARPIPQEQREESTSSRGGDWSWR